MLDRPAAALAPRRGAARCRGWRPALLVAVAALVADLLLAPAMGLLPRLGLAFGVALAAGQPVAAVRAQLASPHAARRLGHGRGPSRGGGGDHRHGVDSAFTQEKLAAARPGDTIDGRPVAGRVSQGRSGGRAQLDGDRRPSFARLAGLALETLQAAEPLLHRAADRDQRGGDRHQLERPALRGASASSDEQGRWQLRLWWKPFVTLIWLGGVLIALGGALALRRPAVRARDGAAAARRRTNEPRAALPAAGAAAGLRRASSPGGWRARPTTTFARSWSGKPVPAFALPPALPGKPGLVVGRTGDAAGRAWSMSSPAGACPASPKRRCWAS